ncbi:MAG: hypothetical protein QXJ59_06700 [Thermofilaceae archaeon]
MLDAGDLIPIAFSVAALIAALLSSRRARSLQMRLERLEREVQGLQDQSRRMDGLRDQVQKCRSQVDALQQVIAKTVMPQIVNLQQRVAESRVVLPEVEAKRIAALIPKNNRRAVVIDGSNVARFSPGSTPSARNLQLAVEWAKSQGLQPVIVIERRTFKQLDNRELARRLRRDRILHPVAVEADEVILELAEQLNAPILSNDEYAEYRGRYRGLKRHPFLIVDGKLHVLEAVQI